MEHPEKLPYVQKRLLNFVQSSVEGYFTEDELFKLREETQIQHDYRSNKLLDDEETLGIENDDVMLLVASGILANLEPRVQEFIIEHLEGKLPSALREEYADMAPSKAVTAWRVDSRAGNMGRRVMAELFGKEMPRPEKKPDNNIQHPAIIDERRISRRPLEILDETSNLRGAIIELYEQEKIDEYYAKGLVLLFGLGTPQESSLELAKKEREAVDFTRRKLKNDKRNTADFNDGKGGHPKNSRLQVADFILTDMLIARDLRKPIYATRLQQYALAEDIYKIPEPKDSKATETQKTMKQVLNSHLVYALRKIYDAS